MAIARSETYLAVKLAPSTSAHTLHHAQVPSGGVQAITP